jgi:hypothetical protein
LAVGKDQIFKDIPEAKRFSLADANDDSENKSNKDKEEIEEDEDHDK